jgi:hypothetical protein
MIVSGTEDIINDYPPRFRASARIIYKEQILWM